LFPQVKQVKGSRCFLVCNSVVSRHVLGYLVPGSIKKCVCIQYTGVQVQVLEYCTIVQFIETSNSIEHSRVRSTRYYRYDDSIVPGSRETTDDSMSNEYWRIKSTKPGTPVQHCYGSTRCMYHEMQVFTDPALTCSSTFAGGTQTANTAKGTEQDGTQYTRQKSETSIKTLAVFSAFKSEKQLEGLSESSTTIQES
jgi:hypothetical protein